MRSHPNCWTLTTLTDPLQTQCGAAQYHVVMLLGEQQDSSHVCLVVVQRVQLRRGHVERPALRETIVQSVVQRQQVHVVHRQVVCVVPALQVTHIDKRRPVKSKKHKK